MRCPVCRADSNEGPSCRRCRADLSLLFQLEEARAKLLRRAGQQAARGNWTELTRLAEKAHFLRRDTDSARLAAIGWLMQAAFDRAWELCQQMSHM
jgi:hypothetical protein